MIASASTSRLRLSTAACIQLLMVPSRTPVDLASVFAAKSALRKSVLRKLRLMSDAEVERESNLVADLLLNSSHYREAHSIGCYLHMPHAELRTDRIVYSALRDGKKLYIPYLPPPLPKSPDISPLHQAGSAGMQMLRLYSLADLSACKVDKWSLIDPTERRQDVNEPREDAMSAEMDMILIPGVAFDEHCNRLGRGKAYYDRFLQSYTAAKRRPLLIALALSQQLLPPGENIPVDGSDFQLDAVAHPRGITWRK